MWENQLLRRLGPDKNVNADRIIILYHTYECVYPAQKIERDDKERIRKKKQQIFDNVSNNRNDMYIERD